MLLRRQTPQREDKHWFHFAAGLIPVLCADYISLRLLARLEPLTTALAIAPKSLDVVEKSLKLFLSVRTESNTALSDAASEYGHDIEKLRSACAKFSPEFAEDDVCALTKHLNDKSGKLYQYMRYGSEITTQGHEYGAAALPVVDKVFSKSILLLPEQHRRVLFFCSPLKNLITGSRFDQSANRDLLLRILGEDNPHFVELVDLSQKLDKEHIALQAS